MKEETAQALLDMTPLIQALEKFFKDTGQFDKFVAELEDQENIEYKEISEIRKELQEEVEN